MKNYLKALIKYTLSFMIVGLIVYLFFRNIDFASVKKSFLNANLFMITAAAICIPLMTFFKVYRWKFILEPSKIIKFKNLLCVYSISQMTTNILPFRAGDIFQIVYLSKKENLSKTTIFSSLAVFQFIDLMSMALIFISVSFFVQVSEKLKITVYSLSLIMCAGFLVYFFSKGMLEKFVSKHSKYFGEKIFLLNEGLKIFSDKKLLFWQVVLTVLIWIMAILNAFFIFAAFKINISFTQILVFLTVPAVATMVPSTPGAVGVWEVAAVAVLVFFGISKESGLAACASMHFISMAIILLLGLYFIMKEGLTRRAE